MWMSVEEQAELVDEVVLVIILSFWCLLAWYEERRDESK